MDLSPNNNRKKIISFSLWGNHKIYTYGAIENAILAQKLFPGWICRFYIGKDVPSNITNYLQSLPNTQLILKNEEHNLSNMFWRFEPMFENDVRIMISRDCDSRLSEKEQILITEWRLSNKDFHIIRDSPGHKKAIMGGLFGARKQICLPLHKQFLNFPRNNQYSQDQKFLNSIVYPFIKNNAFIHDAGFHPNKFTDEIKHPIPKNFQNIIIGDRITLAPIASQIFNEPNEKLERNRTQ